MGDISATLIEVGQRTDTRGFIVYDIGLRTGPLDLAKAFKETA
jgi:hypothetical protein